MQGVLALAGQTSPPDANFSTSRPTPYWKYSVLLGGGRCDSWADARFARPNKRNAAVVAIANGPAFLRRALLRMKPTAFVVEAGSTFVVVTGLTVPESFV
jgi:hypothetical protein